MNTNKLPTIRTTPDVKPVQKNYVVVTGFNFGCTQENPEGTRVEPGFLKVELPPDTLKNLLDQGVIREAK